MAKALVRLLPAGQQQILSGASGISSWTPLKFVVGDSAAYTPQDSDTAAAGNVVYTGGVALMQRRVIDNNDTRLTLTIPEGVGPFLIGNIMIYTADLGTGGAPTPFAEVVLPFQITKELAQYDSGSLNLPNPGSRILVSLNLHNVLIQAGDISSGITVNVTVVAPEYSSLPFFDSDANLPAPELNPWAQFIVNELTATGGPGLVTRRSDNTYWVMPALRNVHDPKYHVLSGGNCGDGYHVDRHDFLWGGRFDQQSLNRGVVGGMAFANYTPYGLNFVGGIAFTDFANSARTPR